MYGNYLDTLPPGLRFVGTDPDGTYVVVDGAGSRYEWAGSWGRTMPALYGEKYDPGSGESERFLIRGSYWEPYSGPDFPPARPGAWLIDPKFDNPGASWWNTEVSGSSAYKATSPSGQQARLVRAPDGSVMLELPADAIGAGVTTGDGSGLLDLAIRTVATAAIGAGIATGISNAYDAASAAMANPDASVLDVFKAVAEGPVGPPAPVSLPVPDAGAGLDVVDDFFPAPPPAAEVARLSAGSAGFVPDPLASFYDDFFPAPVPASELNLLPRLVPAAAGAAASSAAGAGALSSIGSALAKLAAPAAAVVGKLFSGNGSAAPVAVVTDPKAPLPLSRGALLLGAGLVGLYVFYSQKG